MEDRLKVRFFGGEGGCRSACILLDAFLDSILSGGWCQSLIGWVGDPRNLLKLSLELASPWICTGPNSTPEWLLGHKPTYFKPAPAQSHHHQVRTTPIGIHLNAYYTHHGRIGLYNIHCFNFLREKAESQMCWRWEHSVLLSEVCLKLRQWNVTVVVLSVWNTFVILDLNTFGPRKKEGRNR